MSFSPLVDNLMRSLRCLPGVGNKTAQRMALHLLERDRKGAVLLAQAISESIEKVGKCSSCRNLSETSICGICSDKTRHKNVLCVVEYPADVIAIEQSASFRGMYFVLMGNLSPLDGIGPEEIGVDAFATKLNSGIIDEVVLATSMTVEGEATAYFLAEMTKKRNIKTTRIAHGVPLGGELDRIDSGTLARALDDRAMI